MPSSSSASSDSSASSASSITQPFPYPLDNGPARVTKKFFGTYVTPQHSPVSPERFTGYHTGTDFETFTNEATATVTAHAICDGTTLYAGWVSGYGGVMIQSCTYKGSAVTVLYGHLNVDTITVKKGDTVHVGDAIGNLGTGYSHETDGERKHLHVSVHKGSAINFKGYVQSQADLQQWIDAYPHISNG
jgi:murein DD-endopeptidase MepM/ murein hydrolase activator NlpD